MMSDTTPCSVAVLIVCFNGREHLDECLGSVLGSDDGDLQRYVVVVDNASTDGSRDLVQKRFPSVELIEAGTNSGFAGGNNLGWAAIRKWHPEVRYLALLNQDTRVSSGWLWELANYLDEHPSAGAVQPKIMLYNEPQRINTLGNQSHFLGFGFMTGYGHIELAGHEIPSRITYASGAAVMFRSELLERVGLFDDEYFAYLEDAEICWKLRQIGSSTHLVPQSVIYHKHSPTAPFRHYFLLERNRYLLLLTYYRLRTLLLLSPALVLMELGQWMFSLRHGLLRERQQVIRYFVRTANQRRIWKLRRIAQTRRLISDREFLSEFSGTLQFEAIENPLLRYVGNPLLKVYWFVVKRLMFW